MKKLFSLIVAALLLFAGCQVDKDEIDDRFEDLENRVEKLEELCSEMNTNITALQTIVTALQNNDFVTAVTEVTKDGKTVGYTISFSKSGSITIYHGENGMDGNDGKDGHTPVIGVKADADGVYYWTLDGEWLLDAAGNKVRAEGTDGATPQLKIIDGYWNISYDNGKTWKKLGKATGEDGAPGHDASSNFFKSVTHDGDNLYFVLADGTELTIPINSNNPVNRIQSVAYIPKYEDGVAEIIESADGQKSAEFSFIISPKDVISELEDSCKKYVSMKAFYTEAHGTKAVDFIDMPVLSFSGDEASGTITIVASGDSLGQDFYDGLRSAACCLVISDGNNMVTSENIRLTPSASDPLEYMTINANGVEFRMVKVEAGTFIMGAPYDDYNADVVEKPMHKVTITKDYYIGEFEVTQELWEAVKGYNPSWHTGNPKYPVESISWNDINTYFLPVLNELTGMNFRLPTEAQWEYAARGGNKSRSKQHPGSSDYKYSGGDNIDDVAWFKDNSGGKSHPVGEKLPNELGLYDMSGNVSEWCSDCWENYTSYDAVDPEGTYAKYERVVRDGKGNEMDIPQYYRVTFRDHSKNDRKSSYIGFRLVLVP